MPKKTYQAGKVKILVCLHCFARFSPWDIIFTGGEAGEEVKVASTFRDRLSGRYPTFAVDSQGHKLYLKLCPKCKRQLPWTTGQQPELIIGLIGARASGKSHYVATLIRRLQHEVSRDFDATLMHMDDATLRRYRTEFYDPLFEHRQQLLPTMRSQMAQPLFYLLRVSGALWGKPDTSRSVTLAFYDTAGEDFSTQVGLERLVNYLSRAAGLIFLIDPLQSPIVKELVGKSAALHAAPDLSTPKEIIDNVVNQLGSNHLFNSNGKLDIPVAIAFTKCDVLQRSGLIEPHRLWGRDDLRHSQYYDLDLHDDVNGLFGHYMEEWSMASSQTVKANFEDYAYFGVSATGCDPDEQGRFPFVSSWRVEDPLLWLLYRLDIIPGRRGATANRKLR